MSDPINDIVGDAIEAIRTRLKAEPDPMADQAVAQILRGVYEKGRAAGANEERSYFADLLRRMVRE